MGARRVGFGSGVLAFVRGVGWVIATPRAWKDAATPIAIAVVVACALACAGCFVTWKVTGTTSGVGMGEAIVTMVATTFGIVASVVVGTLVAIAIAPPLAGFAMDRIAAQQDEAAGLVVHAPGASIGRSLRVTMTGLAVTLPLLVVLGVVSLAAPPAAVITQPLSFVVGAFAVAWDLLDRPLDRRGLGVRARLVWMRDHFGATLGFGLAAGVTLLIPLGGLLALPMGVAGAAKLVAESDAREKNDPRHAH